MNDRAFTDLIEAHEQLDKIEAQTSFLAFYLRMTGFTPQPHHKIICKALQAVEDDKIERLMVFMPRRMAKSTLCTQLFPAWLMGKHPSEKIMSAVHTQKYAAKTGKIVRNLMRNPIYPFETTLAADSQAKDQWATTVGGEYNGFGLLGGSTHGNPAGILITDDLIKGRKMAMSEHMREEAWETYKADLVSSLQGRRKQIMVTCMTGDTPVLMADKTQKALREIRPGDQIATYENGAITTSKVINFANKGPDKLFRIRMDSGRMVRANARHPFLVKTERGEEWRRTAMLKKGDQILSVIGESGAASPVLPMDAICQQNAKACAPLTMKNSELPKATSLHPVKRGESEAAN